MYMHNIGAAYRQLQENASRLYCMELAESLTVLALSLTTPGRPKLGAALVLLFLFCCHRQSCNHRTYLLMGSFTSASSGQTDMGTLMSVVSCKNLILIMPTAAEL